MTEKLTALTDPENLMVVWDDEPGPEPHKTAKVELRKQLPRRRKTS